MRSKWDYRRMEIRLHPKLLIDQNGQYKLARLEEFIDIGKQFNRFFKDFLGINVPDFFEWQASRVEFAVDLVVSEDLIPRYLSLLKKGNVPDYFLQGKQTQEFWDSETNVYFMSKNKTANWYNRYETLLKKQEKSNKPYEDFSETRGILRFETQVRNGTKSVKDVLNQQRCEKEVLKFYKLIVGSGDYYTLDKAIQLVREKVNSQEKRMALERLLRLIDKTGSVWEAKQTYISEKNKSNAADKFSKRLNQLRKLNINPVTLPLEWGIGRLENLYDRIKDSIESYQDKSGEQGLC